jgi:long-chain fatty acid transport protein
MIFSMEGKRHMKGIIRKLVGFGGLGVIAALSSQAYSAGYKMEFQSASVLADAGDAAVVEDAGTNWYNSAGLVYLPQQAVYSAIDVYAPTSFAGTVVAPSTLATLPPPFNTLGNNFVGSGSASSHPNTVVPALHYVMPIKDRFAFGISVVPAWGFTEDYGENSLLRYNLTRVYTKTIDIAPSIAVKFNNHWSFGLGPDIHYFSVESRAHVRTEGAAPFGTPADSVSRFSANKWGYGLHAGLLFRLDDATRIGLNYRSRIMMNLDGYSDFGLNHGGSFESNSFKLNIPLPPTTTLSVYHDMTPCWALMGTVAYDQWSVLRDYHARNYIQPPTPSNPTGILPNVIAQQSMSNTFDLSAGTHYKLTDKLMLRGSLKYEPTPVQNQYRDVNFPDAPKLGINVGARYTMNKNVAVDVIYAHVFEKTVQVNDVNPATGAVATGHSRGSVELFGAQLVWTI